MHRRILTDHHELSLLARVLGLDAEETGKNNKASLLEQNLFVVLGYVEMIALARLLSIIHISVCIPFRWLAGKTHRLKEYKNWGPPSMARVIDTLREKMNAISNKPEMILN